MFNPFSNCFGGRQGIVTLNFLQWAMQKQCNYWVITGQKCQISKNLWRNSVHVLMIFYQSIFSESDPCNPMFNPFSNLNCFRGGGVGITCPFFFYPFFSIIFPGVETVETLVMCHGSIMPLTLGFTFLLFGETLPLASRTIMILYLILRTLFISFAASGLCWNWPRNWL